MEKLTIVIINYNGKNMIEHCFSALSEQKFRDFRVIFLDNASTDNSLETAKKVAAEKFRDVPFEVFQNEKNTGYSGAAEKAVKICKTKYLMLMNLDIFLDPNYLEVLIDKIEKDPKIGSIIGKLRQYDWQNKKKTNVIDSAGLKIYKNRRVVDRGQAEEDRGQFDREEEVFGITGACPLYRMEALKDIEIQGETFDTKFFMYKEDVDVSWRLQLFAWKCLYVPSAIAYHIRGTGIKKRDTAADIARERKTLSRFQRHYSLINQHIMQIKNEMPYNFFKNLPQILFKEILLAGFTIVREPFLLKSWGQILLEIPRGLKWRKEIMRRKKITAKEMDKWFSS